MPLMPLSCGRSRSRVQRELGRQIDAAAPSHFLVRLHRYGAVKTTGAAEDAGPLLDELDRSVRGRIRAALKRALDVTGSLSLLMRALSFAATDCRAREAEIRGAGLFQAATRRAIR